jgi:hypothetical protein
MAQHDYVIANGTGAAVRSDLNNALAAIVSQNSGAVAPTTTYAYMPWADTGSSPPVFKIRNAANNGWITLYELDGTFSVEAGSASSPGLYFTGDINTGIFSAGADQFNIATNGVERVEWGTSEVVFNDGGANYDFRIEGDTNSSLFFVDASAEAVGIGTTGPTATLHVRAADSDTIASLLRLEQFNSAQTDGARLVISADAANNTVSYDSSGTSSGAHVFLTGSNERLRIDTSGRLLVGTSTDSQTSTLVLKGNSAGATNAGTLRIERGQGAGNITSAGIELGTIALGGSAIPSALVQASSDGNWTAGTSYPTRLVFSVTADGSASPTEALRITNDRYVRLASGSGGIQFNGDTAAANALDDYEEGTFTPTVYGLTTAGTGTYSAQTGNYTKIGNRVCFTLSLTWSAHTGTGNMQIAGLPFVPAASENNRACTLIANNITLTANNFAAGFYANTVAEVLVRQQPVGGGALAFVAMDTAGTFYVSGTYFV